MVRKTTRIEGSLSLSWRTASIPFRRGIEMSATTTSGFRVVASSTSSRPSVAVPTSSNSGSIRLLRPATTIA